MDKPLSKDYQEALERSERYYYRYQEALKKYRANQMATEEFISERDIYNVEMEKYHLEYIKEQKRL